LGEWWARIAFRSPELIARAQSTINLRMSAASDAAWFRSVMF
jgi:hypothetical protein